MSNEERNRLAETYNKFPDAVKVAEIYSVSSGNAYRPARQMKDAGSADLKPGRGRKPSLSPEDIENVRRTVPEEPGITVRELNAKLNPGVSDETVRTRAAESGLRYKKRFTPRNGSARTFKKNGNGGANGRTL